jgi:hypothetical protein
MLVATAGFSYTSSISYSIDWCNGAILVFYTMEQRTHERKNIILTIVNLVLTTSLQTV